MDRGAWETGLDAALIGGREKANIAIADYDPRWPMLFEASVTGGVYAGLGARSRSWTSWPRRGP